MATDNTGIAGLTQQPSMSIEDLYRKALGREADPLGLKHWQEKIGPTAEGDEIAQFLGSPGALQELQQTDYIPFVGRKGPANYSATVGQAYEDLLGREADPTGLKHWQDKYGPTLEGQELTDFLYTARPELMKSGFVPLSQSGADNRANVANNLLEYTYNPASGKTYEEFLADTRAPAESGALDKYWSQLNKAVDRYKSGKSRMDLQDLQRYAKPSSGEFMAATGLDWDTAGELLYGAVGSNQDTRDWAKIMASSNPAAAAREGLKQMYGGYGLKISPPGYTADPNDDFDRQRTYLTDAQGKILTHIGDYDPTTGTSTIGANKRAALAFGANIPALAQRYGMKIDVPEFEGQKNLSYSQLEKLINMLAPPKAPKITKLGSPEEQKEGNILSIQDILNILSPSARIPGKT